MARTNLEVPSPIPISPFWNETLTIGAVGTVVSRSNVTSPESVSPSSFSESPVPVTRRYFVAPVLSSATVIAPLNETPVTFWIVATAESWPAIPEAPRTKKPFACETTRKLFEPSPSDSEPFAIVMRTSVPDFWIEKSPARRWPRTVSETPVPATLT